MMTVTEKETAAVVCRCTAVQQQAAVTYNINPLSPHDALKHHYTSLKKDFIFLQLKILE